MSLNDILFRYTSSGASAATAAQDDLRAGVDASHQMAMTDLPRLKKYSADFLAVGLKHGLPPALLAAISSRETRGGGRLNKSGYGSNGADFGLMQVNKDSHKLVGSAFSREHIDQAAGILKKFHLAVKKKHPSWSPEQQLRGSVAAYNFGVSNVQTLGGIDEGTANDDYSSDVWERAKALAPHFGGIGDAARVSSSSSSGPKTVSPTPVVIKPIVSEQGGSKAMSSQPAVYELQMILVKYGYMTEEQVQTGPGILGPKTQAAVARFLEEHGRTSPSGKPGSVASGGGTSSSEGPKSVFPTKSVAMIDGVPLYRQGDKAWAKTNLGPKENLSIHAAGCAMTSVAMAISKISGKPINPKELDAYLDSHGGYSGNSLVWDVAAKSRGLYATRLHNCSLVSIDKELAAGRPVVAGVDYKKGSGGGGNGTDHWVTITGKYTEGAGVFYSAHDPTTGQKFTFKVDGTRLQSTNAIQKYFTTGEICTFKSAAKAKVS